jgi:hypothetical protein
MYIYIYYGGFFDKVFAQDPWNAEDWDAKNTSHSLFFCGEKYGKCPAHIQIYIYIITYIYIHNVHYMYYICLSIVIYIYVCMIYLHVKVKTCKKKLSFPVDSFPEIDSLAHGFRIDRQGSASPGLTSWGISLPSDQGARVVQALDDGSIWEHMESQGNFDRKPLKTHRKPRKTMEKIKENHRTPCIWWSKP